MKVTLDIPDDNAAAMQARASAIGMPIEQWLVEVLKTASPANPAIPHLSSEEWTRRYQEWLAMPRPDMPDLTDEQISRATIYDDRA
jgi:hypothetical protein